MLKLSSALHLVRALAAAAGGTSIHFRICHKIATNIHTHSLTKEENDHDHEDCLLLLFLGILPRRWRFTSIGHCLDWIYECRLGIMAVIVRSEATTWATTTCPSD